MSENAIKVSLEPIEIKLLIAAVAKLPLAIADPMHNASHDVLDKLSNALKPQAAGGEKFKPPVG